MSKRILAILLCLTMLFCFSACGGDETSTSSEASTGTSDEAVSSETPEESSLEESSQTIADGVVPNVIGKSFTEAEELFKASNVKYRLNGANHPTLAEGIVIETDYTAGENVGHDTYVIITYSLGKSEADIALEPAKNEFVANRTELEKGANSDYVPLNYDEMKCIWLSQFDLQGVYRENGTQTSKEVFVEYIETIMDNVKALGLNTVIVQARPYGDSFCVSEYYPWSSFIAGDTGRTPDYDPYQIMIDEAHERGLSFQAWINPMRGMLEDETRLINISYPIRQWIEDEEKSDTYVKLLDGRWYLNPAYEEVRQLIIDGAAEICRYYDVDGVHMDDYFYPSGTDASFDKKAFDAQKLGGFTSLKAYRYNNLNLLVSGLYSAVKAENPNMLFGISPAGNLDNVLNSHYADMTTWLSTPGYVDYIMPQFYWGFEHKSCPFEGIYKRWGDLIKVDSIKYTPGISLGRAVDASNGNGDSGAGAGKNEWIENKDVFERMLKFMSEQPNCQGFSIYCYQYIFNPRSGESVSSTAEEQENFIPVVQAWESNKIDY